MDEKALIEELEREGFTEVRVCPMPEDALASEHTHDAETVHIVLEGELVIVDAESVQVYEPGDRVVFPAGTTHTARGTGGRMIVGFR